MRTKAKKHGYLVAIAVLVATLLVPVVGGLVPASAQQNGNQGDTGGNGQGTSQARLEGRSLEKCQNREKAINSIMARVGDRGQKQIDVIEGIQTKVQQFYQAKNLSVSTYDQLMAKVQDRRTAAVQAANQVRNMNGKFSCGNDDPKGVTTQFRQQAASQSDAVVAYKNAVHDLVVAIKTAMEEN